MAYPQQVQLQGLCDGYDNVCSQFFGCDGEQGLAQNHVPYPLFPFSVSQELSSLQPPLKEQKRKEKAQVVVFRTRSETTSLDDGFRWRKYGRKTLKCRIHPRDYFKCSEDNCGVKKKVEKDPEDESVVITIYEGIHNHEAPSTVYYITEPLAVATPGSKPAILVVDAGTNF